MYRSRGVKATFTKHSHITNNHRMLLVYSCTIVTCVLKPLHRSGLFKG